MYDEYVEEIRRIRERQYEETKDMTPDEERAYTKVRADEFERRVAEYRAINAAKKAAAAREAVAVG